MAIALECTLCLILIGLYNPATCHQIIRSLCLETAVEFMYNHEKCKFDFGYAQNSLKDKNSSCQTKCEVKIESLKDTENTLWEVGISFGSVVSNYWSQCRDIEDRNKLTMFIACPKWNTVKIPVGGYCKLDEQCQGIEHSGVCKNERCVCRAGYVLYNLECHEVNLPLNQACSFSEQCSGSPYVSCLGGKCSCIDVEGQFTDCIEIKVPIGGYCKQDEQCQGIEHSGVCKNERCVCRTGYVSYNLECHEGNLALNQSCSFSEQCSESPYASCLGGKCSCIKGYTAEEYYFCVQMKVPVGGYCTQNKQCQGSENSGVCEHERCVCRTGYIQYNLKCHEGNLTLNQPCFLSEQCSGSPYAICLEGKCSCIKGYTAEGSYCCVQIKVPVGGYCTQNEQCQGSKNSGVCEHERCVCRTGYILFNLECYEGNLALNQSCIFSEQCSGSPYASCLGRKCSCIVGYTAENSTDCVQRNLALNQSCSFSEQCAGSPYASCLGEKCSCVDGYTAENATSCVQSQKSILPKFQHQEANIGTTLGALFGGLLLGVILTTVAVMIMYRRSKKHVNKREEFNVTFADNDTYSSAKVVDPKAFQNIQTKNKKLEVSPYPGSKETSVYNKVCGKPKNGQTQDDVYNHLHEQVKRDDVDYYDHACAASANIGDMGAYSHLRHTTS